MEKNYIITNSSDIRKNLLSLTCVFAGVAVLYAGGPYCVDSDAQLPDEYNCHGVIGEKCSFVIRPRAGCYGDSGSPCVQEGEYYPLYWVDGECGYSLLGTEIICIPDAGGAQLLGMVEAKC